ncbi:MAG: GNAT family N-acetyltransferase [Rhizobiaceae bacterium]
MKITIATSPEAKALCYRLRHIVFVEEQKVPVELEIDDHDENGAIHFLGRVEGEPVAASRLCLFGEVAKIQRVVVLKDYRSKNYGREIMQHMLDYIRKNKVAPTIALDAQTYALPFYEGLGFVVEGDEFDDAGIPHSYMSQPA